MPERSCILVDSHGWIEFFSAGPLATKYEKFVKASNPADFVTPSIVLYEVYKRLKAAVGEDVALDAVAYIISNTTIVSIDRKIALNAAEASVDMKLGMADALVKAVAEDRGAKIVTGDPHFKGLSDVIFVE